MILLAIDPGRDAGFARFTDGHLSSAWLSHPPFVSPFWGGATHAIIEQPVAYPHQPVDPNDLLILQRRASEIAGALMSRGIHVEYVFPRTWKGQMPKDVCHARARKRLTPQDIIVHTTNHNVWDAIALGLWKLGRL